MMNLKNILERWNFVRALRLVLGGAILVQGIIAHDIPTMLFGSLFSGMAVANIGCCGPTGCSINTTTSGSKNLLSQAEPDDNK